MTLFVQRLKHMKRLLLNAVKNICAKMDRLRQFSAIVLIILKLQLSSQSCERNVMFDNCLYDHDYYYFSCIDGNSYHVLCEDITQVLDRDFNLFLGRIKQQTNSHNNPVYYYRFPEERNQEYEYTVLQFSKSNITTITNNFFRSAKEIRFKMLYLNNNYIETINRRGLNYLENLYYLNIAENFITKLFAGTFDGLNLLENINLSHNLISSIESDIFSDLKSIQVIDLSYNKLSELDNNIFATNKQLKTLNVIENCLTILYNGTFKGLYNLERLKLNYNTISVIEEDTFLDLQSVKEIDLSHNNLSEIPDYIFSNLDNLCNLNLSRNTIVALNISSNTNMFAKCYGAIFDLSYNKLLYLDHNSFEGKNIQSLKINNNFIISEDKNIDIASVEYCDFSYNIQLNSIFVNNSKQLKIHHTVIKSTVVFGNLITDLDLTSTMIPLDLTTFKNAISLKRLLLDNNNLVNINEDVFESTVNLNYLSLGNNSISSLPTGIFRALYNLESLSLNNNNLFHFEFGIFSNLENLRELNLGENKLKQLEVGILYNLHSIQYINLTNNFLSFLNFEDLVRHIIRQNDTNKILIALDHNYWPCSWLVQALSFVRKNNFVIEKGNSYKKSNVKGIACRNNTSLNLFSQEPKQDMKTLPIITSPTTLSSTIRKTTVHSTPPQTSINSDNLHEIVIEEATTEVSVDIKTSETETYIEFQPVDDKSSTIINNHDHFPKKMHSSDAIKYNINKTQDTLTKENTEIRGLIIFISILLCIIFLSQLYLIILHKFQSMVISRNHTTESCNLELIDNCKNDNEI